MAITEQRAEEALHHLANTDERYAEAKSRVKALEYRLKVVKATAFLAAKGTMAEKESTALCSQEYRDMLDEYETHFLEMETLGAKRKREELIWEHWRSVNANRRAGSSG